ncbi:hypothetical protein T06_518 [Trichinella sp. T6]|nr:hypothetical protein T06_518 [Trichinella sp. T6]
MEKSNKGTWKLVIIKQNDREPRLFQNTPYKTTGQFPAELQVGKGLPTLLDRTKPHLSIKRDIEIWKQKMTKKTEACGSTNEAEWRYG